MVVKIIIKTDSPAGNRLITTNFLSATYKTVSAIAENLTIFHWGGGICLFFYCSKPKF